MSEIIERPASQILSPANPSLVASLVTLSKTVRAMMGLKLAEIELYVGQDELLLALDMAKPQPVSKIAEMLEVRPSTVSKMLDRLVVKDLASRVIDEADGRRTCVQITQEGMGKVAQIIEIRTAIDLEISKALRTSILTTTAADVEALSQIIAARLHRLR